MALTIQPQIAGQELSNAFSYCYLYEPLVAVATESNTNGTKLYIDMEVVHTDDDTMVFEELIKYAEFDLNPDQSISFDLMDLAKQYHDAQLYLFSDSGDVINNNGWAASVSKYKYNFKIYTDVSTIQEIKKLPIIGGRRFNQFNSAFNLPLPTNEFEYYGLDTTEIRNRWGGNLSLTTIFKDPTLQNARPTLYNEFGPLGGKKACEGWLLWKSRFGGWMFWGFDIKNRSTTSSYDGNLEVGMFDSTKDILGAPFIPVDYTGISESYTITLKSLSLSSLELLAVDGIKSSPAIYYSEIGNSKMELMRLSSATTPQNSLANGGDFSVSLRSISRTSQKTI